MFWIKSPVDSDSQQSSTLIPRTSLPSWRRHQVQKVGQNDASGTDRGHFSGKWGKRKRCRIPARVWGKDQQSHGDPQLLIHLLMSLPVNYSFQMVSRTYALSAFWSLCRFSEAACARQLMLRVPLPGTHCPLLETPKSAPPKDAEHQHPLGISSKIISAQEAKSEATSNSTDAPLPGMSLWGRKCECLLEELLLR